MAFRQSACRMLNWYTASDLLLVDGVKHVKLSTPIANGERTVIGVSAADGECCHAREARERGDLALVLGAPDDNERVGGPADDAATISGVRDVSHSRRVLFHVRELLGVFCAPFDECEVFSAADHAFGIG